MKYNEIAQNIGLTTNKMILANTIFIGGVALGVATNNIIKWDSFSDNQLKKIEVCIDKTEVNDPQNENNIIDISALK